MKRMRKRGWAMSLVLAATVGSAGGLGLQLADAQPPPPCTTCTCKGVYHWWSSGLPKPARGAFQMGVNVSYAYTSIKTTGGCQSGQQTANGTCDFWDFTTSTSAAKPPKTEALPAVAPSVLDPPEPSQELRCKGPLLVREW